MSSRSAPFMTLPGREGLAAQEIDVERAVAPGVEDLIAAVGARGVAARAAVVDVARGVPVGLPVDQVVVAVAADESSRPLPPVRSSPSPAPRSVSSPSWPFRLSIPPDPRRTSAARAAQDLDEALDRRAVVAVAELDLRDVLRERADRGVWVDLLAVALAP